MNQWTRIHLRASAATLTQTPVRWVRSINSISSSIVRLCEIGNGISEASKRVPIFPLSPKEASKRVPNVDSLRNWVLACEAQIRFPAGWLELDSIEWSFCARQRVSSTSFHCVWLTILAHQLEIRPRLSTSQYRDRTHWQGRQNPSKLVPFFWWGTDTNSKMVAIYPPKFLFRGNVLQEEAFRGFTGESITKSITKEDPPSDTVRASGTSLTRTTLQWVFSLSDTFDLQWHCKANPTFRSALGCYGIFEPVERGGYCEHQEKTCGIILRSNIKYLTNKKHFLP